MTQTNPTTNRRRFRFSLRTLLAVMVLLSLPLGWFGWKLREADRQRRAVEAIEAAGGAVHYNYQWDESTNITVEEPPTPVWLRRLIGDDFLSDIVGVGYRYPERVGDVLLGHLDGLTTLEFLDLYETHVTDVGLEKVEGLTRLEWLDLSCTQVGDAGLRYLRGLTKLKHLNLNGTHVTDGGLEKLRGLADLKALGLAGTNVMDAGLRNLKGLRNLRHLNLVDTQVTEKGVNELQEALPNCKINWDGPITTLKTNLDQP